MKLEKALHSGKRSKSDKVRGILELRFGADGLMCRQTTMCYSPEQRGNAAVHGKFATVFARLLREKALESCVKIMNLTSFKDVKKLREKDKVQQGKQEAEAGYQHIDCVVQSLAKN